MRRGVVFDLSALSFELQIRILAMAGLPERFKASLTCRAYRDLNMAGVATVQRVSRLMASADMRTCGRVSLEIVGSGTQSVWALGHHIRLGGTARLWRVSSSIGREQTDLRTPSLSRIMNTFMELLPALQGACGHSLSVLRNGNRWWVSHVFAGPEMAMQPEPWDVDTGCAGNASDAAHRRLQVVLPLLKRHNDVIIGHMGQTRTSHIRKLDPIREGSEEWLLCEWGLGIFSETVFVDIDTLVEHIIEDPDFRPAVIQLVRHYGDDKATFHFPDFRARQPAWAT